MRLHHFRHSFPRVDGKELLILVFTPFLQVRKRESSKLSCFIYNFCFLKVAVLSASKPSQLSQLDCSLVARGVCLAGSALFFARKHRLKRNALNTAVRLVQAHLPFARKNGSERDDADDAGLSLKPRVNGPARAWL